MGAVSISGALRGRFTQGLPISSEVGQREHGLLIFSTRLLFGSNLIYRKTTPTIPSGAGTLAATRPI